MAARGGEPVPAERFLKVRRNALARLVHRADRVLRFGDALVGERQEELCRLRQSRRPHGRRAHGRAAAL